MTFKEQLERNEELLKISENTGEMRMKAKVLQVLLNHITEEKIKDFDSFNLLKSLRQEIEGL